MVQRSLFYQSPWIYRAGLLLIHGKHLDERYKYIADQIGKGKSVLEPACGTALLPDYLDKSCTYTGFDKNERFVRHAQKKSLHVNVGNALDPAMYTPCDTAVFCDALHHIGLSNELSAIERALHAASQQLIICEPFKDRYLGLLPNWIPGSQKVLETWFDYIEKDGNNQVRLKDIRMRKELEEIMMEGYGIIPPQVRREINNIGEDLIVTYHL
ncbi:MAG: class I SAM-dependent methyltransferase [Nanoarchaeota archaeon]